MYEITRNTTKCQEREQEERTYGPEGGHNEPLMKTPQL